ncbi:fibrobacter succinogenes major paralogous domain-containing protein [Fibrobacter sp. UWH4]|uniref:fibrobacter succinogenes major paralogous domain-containing protein n=1 Tax=Fibrobacter sp. UWH4 TaxID=1896210 RepID=UPI0009245EA6|nr:fibrobacter succinogenes major paralogous domain-containing protein [Fibrobacter sp. UWH4]SHL07800.1 major paralogous domain-containing protein [Fibrobacter sp. UWH4]
MAWLKSMKNKYVVMNLLKVGVTISCCSHLFACGGDSSNSSKATVNDDGREVGTLAEMGRCTIEREGDTVYVAEKLTDYLCQNNTWIDLSEISDGNNPPDVMPGSSSAMSVSSSATSENSESVASSSSLNKEAYSGDSLVVKNRSILGVAQKGPFMFGSPVYLRELTEDSLKYTGMVYEDEVSSNKGDFVIPNVSLLSPYACVEVHGQYRNEITGEYSRDSISLFALTDLKTALSDEKNEPRNKVNVNLLTHLEYSRALYLVRKGYSVYAAKKQADQEIMTAFELPTTVKYSENLSVFEDSQDDNMNYANASLMVLSLLFLGERTDAEITAAIDSFIVDFESDGVWDDAETKTAMADFATKIDISGIRANVKAWNILDVPKFENPLETFWNNVYGLGGCSDKRLNVVAPNSNKLSKNYNKYFICDGSHWNDATTYQKDPFGWSAGKSGEFKKGNVTDTIYVFNGSNWEVSKRETSIGLCAKNNAGVVSKYDGIYYICKNSAWETATVLEYDTYGWKSGTEGEVKSGSVNAGKFYVYENGVWRASANEIEDSLGACVTGRENEKNSLNGKYYLCESKKWVQISAEEFGLGYCSTTNEGIVSKLNNVYYICKSKTWTVATALEYDTYGWKAGTEGEVRAGKVNADKHYVYENGAWRASANEIEDSLGACVVSREGSIEKMVLSTSSYGSSYRYYICKSKVWTDATTLECDTYGWNAGTEGEVKVGSVYTYNYYIYKNGKWQAATSVEKNLGGCTIGREGEVGKSGTNYYICKSMIWTIATKLELNTYGKTCLTDGSIVNGEIYSSYKYVCDSGVFRDVNDLEVSLNKGCVSYIEGDEIRIHLSLSYDSVYSCSNSLWNATKEFVGYGSLTDNRDGKTYKTTVIGSQTWMAENLNYSDSTTYIEMKDRSWCYNNDIDSCSKYGRLYSWSVAMDSVGFFSTHGKGCGYKTTCWRTNQVRGICPEGWHLPNNTEWETLFATVGSEFVLGKTAECGTSYAGIQLKSQYGWKCSYYDTDCNGTNTYGFSALPAGERMSGRFVNRRDDLHTIFITPNEYNENMMYVVEIGNGIDGSIYRTFGGKSSDDGYSIRCVKD